MKRKKNKYHLLVEKFIKEPKKLLPKDWARETKIAKKLYEKYDSEKFWRASLLDFKLNSLAWFLSKEGSEFLDKNYHILKLKLPKQKKVKLGDKIYQTKEQFKNKPKTTLDFLKNKNADE